MADLTRDWKQNFVEIFDPMLLIQRAEVEESAEELADDANGMKYAEWDVARLVLLPRMVTFYCVRSSAGICLLDIASKIFLSMCVRRLETAMEEEGINEH
jgi:hypothetical protein